MTDLESPKGAARVISCFFFFTIIKQILRISRVGEKGFQPLLDLPMFKTRKILILTEDGHLSLTAFMFNKSVFEVHFLLIVLSQISHLIPFKRFRSYYVQFHDKYYKHPTLVNQSKNSPSITRKYNASREKE